jgi:hypothetical protein
MFFMPAVRGRKSQYFFRPAAPDVIVREEAGEMLANDLLGLIPFDPLGTGIPSDDTPLQVQHQDGVIVNFAEERSILVLTVPLRQPASAAGADETNTRNDGGQQAQGGSHNQGNLGLSQAPLRNGRALYQQSDFFGLHLLQHLLTFIRYPLIGIIAARTAHDRRVSLAIAPSHGHAQAAIG